MVVVLTCPEEGLQLPSWVMSAHGSTGVVPTTRGLWGRDHAETYQQQGAVTAAVVGWYYLVAAYSQGCVSKEPDDDIRGAAGAARHTDNSPDGHHAG